LHGVLLLDLGQDEQALGALRRALYLDRSVATAHFLLGSVLRRRGDSHGARRAYRNARDLAAARPADEPLPFGDGGRAGQLANAAEAELTMLESPAEATA